MKEHIIYQRLYGLVVMSSFMFLSDTLSLKGKKLDFYGRHDTYVSLANTIPELSRFTVCIDLVSMVDKSSYWMAFSYITKSTILGREVIDLGLAGDHQQLILYNLGKTFYIRRRLTPLQWHTVCLIWDGAKGRLELFLDKERILVIMDRPHSLTPNGTLVLGHFPKNRENQVQSRRLHFTGSLYYFQLWDRVLEKEEFMKCLDGNIVSWEEDIWLVHKIIPTPDRRLRCFVFENMTVQERSTTLSQQIDLTIPSQITGLKPQETIHSSTVMSKSMPVFVTDYTTISYSNTISPPLATMTVSKILNTSLSGTATFADILSTSIATTLPTQSTSIHATTGSMKITKYPSSESTRTTKMVEAIATEKFHPTTATNFFSTSGFIKNSFVSKTSATESQSAIMKTTLFSTTESTSNSTTSWPKHKSTDFAALSISASAQEYLIATAVSTVPWSTVEETTAITTGTGSSSAFTPESLLTSTAAPMNSEVPRNQTSSTLATPDMEVTFTVHSVRPIETTPVLRTAETELASPKFQGVSLPSMEDAMSTSMPKETSSMALYPMTSSIVIGTQSVQMVTDAESTHTALTPGITLAPTVAETMLSPTSARPVCTQNTPTAGDHMLTLTPTKSASTPEASESVPASVTDETAHWFSTNKTTWTSRPGQTLLTSTNSPTILTVVPNENFTSAFHDNTTNTEISSTGINIAPPEASTESKATASTDATAARYTTALFKSTSPQFADFSSVSETTSVTSLPEFKVTTLLLKTIPVSTVAVSEHSLIPRETVVPSVATTADMKRNLSTEESTSETTQAETNGTSTSVDTTTPVPKTATTPRVNATVMRKETTSHHLGETSTIATVAEASPFSAVLEEATDESSQTASVTFSPFPDTEKLTTTLDNKIVTSEMGWSWFSTKLMKSTPKNSYNGTTEILNSTHTYTTPWTSETPEGNSTPSPTSGSTQTFNPLGASTTSILETSFSTAPTDRTAMSLSASILPAQTTALHFSATTTPVTHTVSPPNNISVVTSVVVSDENKVTTPEPSTVAIDFSTSVLSDVSTLSSATMTTASGTPLGKTASTTSNTLSTHRDSLYTTSEATVISATMTFTAAPSLKKTLVPSLRPLTPMTTKAKSTLPSTSTGTVTPSIHTLLCSKPPPDNIPIVTSAHVISTTATPVATQPVSQVEETSTPALSFPYTSSGGEDVVSLATGTTQTSTVDATMPSHTSANKLATLGGIHISPSSKLPVNTQVSTQLVTGTSTSSSDKEQMTISLGKTPRTMQVTEISPSKDSFISYSQTTSDLEMTDMGFSETTEISNHQTHLSTEIPLGTSPDGNSAVPSTSASTQSIHILTSSNTVDVHISEMSTSLEKTSLPSQALTITKILPPEKESASVLSVSLESVSCGKCPFHTPKSVEMIVSSSSVTHPVSTVQDTSFANITTSRTTISTSLSHLSSLKTQPEVTSVASSISESTQAFPKSLMPSTTGLSNANFTVNSNDGITTAVSVPNAPTTLSGETSLETSIPIYKMSPSPVNVTAFASKNVSTTPTILITKPSKTTRPGCLKSPSVATSGPLSEMSSMPVNDSAFSPTVVSSDTSREVGSFSTLLSSTTPRTTMNIQTSTLAVTPVTYAGPTSKKSSVISSAFTNSEMTNMSSKITPTSVFAPTEPTFPSTKTISTMARVVTSDVGTTASSLLNSKNTEAISSIPKTTFSPLPSTTQLSLRDETTTPSILPGITNSSFSTMSSGKVTDFTNTYSRTAVPESGLSPTPSDNAHTSLATQVSPSLTSLKRTPGPTENVKAITAYLSSHTKKMTSSSENTFLTTELTKSATSVNTSALYSPWTPSSTTTLSLTSLLHSLHSTEAKFSTPKLSPPPTSQMVEFPVLGTRITSSNTQSLLTTSWNTPTMTRVPTPNKMETETLHLIPGSLSTFAASQTGLVSRGVMATSSFPTPEILPSFGPSESRSSSISSRVLSTTLADIKHPFEKKSTFVTPGTTLLSSPPTVSKAATSPMLTWILSSLPSGSPLTMGSNASPAPTSSIVKVSKSTFLTSDTIPTYPFTNFATLPFATGSTILTKTPPVSTLGSITSGSPTSLPISTKTADATVHIFASPEASSRTTMTDNSRTVSQSLTYSGMSASPSTTDHAHTISVGSTPPPPSPTKMTAWSRFPAASASSALIPPKPTLDSLINTITTKPTATGASIPLISTEVTHPTATVSSLISSSFETTWPDSTSSIPSTESFTSPTAARSPVSFYNIEMSLSISEEEPKVPITSVINEFARNWLNSVFQHSEFSLANLAIQINGRDTSMEEMVVHRDILGQREGQEISTISHETYSCACLVIIKANSALTSVELISRIRSKIHGNFTYGIFTQNQLTLLVKADHIVVTKIDPGKCKADETSSIYKGTYKWPLTEPTETAQTRCIKNEDGNATRICSISIQTGKCQWEKPRLKQCKLLQELPNKIMDLANITISDENADDVAEHILNLVNESSLLDEDETKIIVSKVAEISKCDDISLSLTQVILQTISAVSEKQNHLTSNLHEISDDILRTIERLGHKMEFEGSTANVTVAGLALAVLRVDHEFNGMAFSIRSYEEVTTPEIYLSSVPLEKVLASIYLPKSLRERIPLNSFQTILFSFFGQTSLFKARNITSKALTTYVVSASISDMSIQSLADPVVITLRHIGGNRNYDHIHCAFWDFEINNGLGGWNSSGCEVEETTVNYTICQCDHLTHFGVLMDLSRSMVDAVNERILVIITYTGCGISSIFLGIAMVTYIAFHKLRKDYPSKILINLCTALLMLNLAFLVNSWLSSFQNVGLCITAAVGLHYFLLVSLTWMGLEAVHMYFALVKVFNIYIPNYILKFCLVGWGIPAITVAVILSVKKDLYGTLSPTTPFCWITDDSIFYISVVAYFCLIFIMNLSMFCIVLAQLNSVKFQSQKTRKKMILHDLKGTISLTFLLGLTWGFAFFAWGPVRIFFTYLFAICNTLQGFLIFVFYCVMKESVREQWHIHLHCRLWRLDNSSDGSIRCRVHVGSEQERLKKTFQHKLLTPSFKSTATSFTFKSIGSAQETPSEISFSNDDFDGDPYCFSPLSCEVMPNCLRRILPAEIKMNSIHKQGSFSINLSTDAHLPSSLDWGKC